MLRSMIQDGILPKICKDSIDYTKILKELAALSEPVSIPPEIPLRIRRVLGTQNPENL
jgi:hypothetical protein